VFDGDANGVSRGQEVGIKASFKELKPNLVGRGESWVKFVYTLIEAGGSAEVGK
jgi:hypothetical protein